MMNRKLRIVYMGTPAFAVAPLKAILDAGFEIAAVITAPDKPSGRGRNSKSSPVKEFSISRNLRLLQPVNLKDAQFLDELRSLDANLQVVVAFRMLPEAVWDMPELGTFNLHASLLPQYRGAAPINWAIINGETETGLSTFFLTHEIDTGKIIFQEKLAIFPDDNAGSLHDRLAANGSQLVIKTLQAIQSDSCILHDQLSEIDQPIALKKAPKLYKQDGRIDWNLESIQIHNLIRGLSPSPGAYSALVSPEGKTYSVKLFLSTVEPSESDKKNGSLITDGRNYLLVRTAAGALKIHEIQLEGKNKLSVTDFLRGFQINEEWKMS